MIDENTRRVQILERAFSIMEEVILDRVGGDEKASRIEIEDDIKLRLRYAEDDLERLATEEAHKKLNNLSFEELLELRDILISNIEDEEEEEDEDVSELFKIFIACKEEDSFTFIDIDGEEKTFIVKARTCLKDGYYALLFPLHRLPRGEVPFSRYYKFVFGDEGEDDHFELVTDEAKLKELESIFDDF